MFLAKVFSLYMKAYTRLYPISIIMKRILFILIAGTFFGSLSAQVELSGCVVDSNTLEPVVGAAVYLNSTSVGTTTDADGAFVLSLPAPIYTSLVVSHLSYHSFAVTNPYDSLPAPIQLTLREFELDDIVVSGGKKRSLFSEKQLMNAFRVEFLGETAKKKKCVILNESDIRVQYDAETNTLTASCNHPIQIKNPDLGYEIDFNLEEFTIFYMPKRTFTHPDIMGEIRIETNTPTIDKEQIISTTLKGHVAFRDIGQNNHVVMARRKEAYQRSSRFFFRNLLEAKLKANGFELYTIEWKALEMIRNRRDFIEYMNVKSTQALEYSKQTNEGFSVVQPSELFLLPESPSSQQIRIHPQIISKDLHDGSFLYAFVKVEQRIKDEEGKKKKLFSNSHINDSFLAFLVDEFAVDSYGNIHAEGFPLYLGGEYSRRRIVDLLPLDYQP